MIVKLINKTGNVKICKTGFSWTTLFFSFIVPLFRGDLVGFAQLFLTDIFTAGGLWLFFWPFVYNKKYIERLLDQGYKPFSEGDLEQLREIEVFCLNYEDQPENETVRIARRNSFVTLVNGTGATKQCKKGFSWTSLFFGFFDPLYRGDFFGLMVLFLTDAVTAGIAWFLWPFFYNKWYTKRLVEKNWIPYSKNDIELLGEEEIVCTKSIIDSFEDEIMHEKNMQKETSKQKVIGIAVHVFVYMFLILMGVIVLFPFYWMIISSLKTLQEYRLSVPTFFPRRIMFSNYSDAFTTASLGRLFLNTLYVGIVSTILSLIITILSAFAFARLEFKGKNILFAGLLATMMIPGELFTITNYSTVTNFGWINTYTVLIVPFLVSVFYIYLLRQNFLQIPNELYLAAKVDGTSDFKYLCKVMIPLSLPTLISITILKMMGAWNSYIWPRLVANDAAHRMVTNGLRNAFKDTTGDVNYPVQMAAVALVSAPLFLVFVFLRKYIMKGVSRSGIKG